MEPKYLVKFCTSVFRDQLWVNFDGFVSIHFELSFEFWVFVLLVDPCCKSFGFLSLRFGVALWEACEHAF